MSRFECSDTVTMWSATRQSVRRSSIMYFLSSSVAKGSSSGMRS